MSTRQQREENDRRQRNEDRTCGLVCLVLVVSPIVIVIAQIILRTGR